MFCKSRVSQSSLFLARKRVLAVTALAVLLCMTSAGAAGTFRVNAASLAGTPTGLSWASAFQNIQDGVFAADQAGGGEVWVAQGTYTNPGPNSMAVDMAENVHIYGGFAGTETARSQRNWTSHLTVIDGQNSSQGATGANNSTLDGFTIKRGYSGFSGGGMYNAGTAPVVANCVFINNKAYSDGGAIENNSASPTVINCDFVDNEALNGYGGAIGTYLGSPAVSGCVFSGNAAKIDGGALHSTGGAPTFTNCQIADNTAVKGSAANSDNSAVLFTNCTFTGNIANAGGSAIYGNLIGPTLKNCIAWGDTVAEIAGAAATVTYSCVQGGHTGTGNISTNPLFTSGYATLQASSPCIDTGTASGAPTTDLLGLSRPAGAGYDMGAYEYGATAPTVAVPNVVGLASADAETAITDAGLTFTVVEEISDTVPLGDVIAQDPVGGTNVTPGSDVTLTVSSSPTAGSGCAGCQTAKGALTLDDLKKQFGDTLLAGVALLALLAVRGRRP